MYPFRCKEKSLEEENERRKKRANPKEKATSRVSAWCFVVGDRKFILLCFCFSNKE